MGVAAYQSLSQPLSQPLGQTLNGQEWQHWYVTYVPMGGGVYALEVDAPKLVERFAQEQIAQVVVVGEPPLPPTYIPEPSTGLLMMAALLMVVAMQRRRV